MRHAGFSIWSDAVTRSCAIYCAIGLIGFIGWAGFVPLDEGIVTQGRVVVENNRRVVQHLEGGIVQTATIREGDLVELGDPLIYLSETASSAQRDQIAQRVAALSASRIALETLRDNGAEPDFSSLSAAYPRTDVQSVAQDESDLFAQRRAAHAARLAVLDSRRTAAQDTAENRRRQIEIAEAERALVRAELDFAADMLASQMVHRNEVSRLERELARLSGDITRLASEKETALASRADLATQIQQANSEFAQTISQELRDTQAELLLAEDALKAAQDVFDRSVIIAPVSGRVLNLDITTEGGVIAPGQVLMEIVPESPNVIVALRVSPHDRAMVFEGLKVRTRLSAYRGWATPEIEGEVITLSADLKTDTATGLDYYEALVQLPEESLSAAGHPDTPPGMPVDAFVFSGRQRTTLEMLLAPILESLFRGLRAS